jgi:Glycosyltransferase family 87
MSRAITRIAIVAAVFLAIAVFGGLVWANTVYVRAQPLEKQFLVPWLSARTYLQYGVSPYDDQATQRAQVVYYGRLALEGEDPLKLATPFPVELLYFPFALITDYPLALGLWMTLGEIALLAAAFLNFSLTGWRPRWFILPFLFIFAVLGVYSFQALARGSAAPLVVFGLMAALSEIKNERDELGGALLALSFFKPSIAAVFLLFMLWWVIANRRGRVVLGFLMAVGLITLISFFLLPAWFFPYLRGFVSAFRYQPGLTVGNLLAEWWPAIGSRLGLIISLALAILLLVEWRALRGKDFRHVLWTASLTMVVAPLLDLPTSLDAHILLFLPFVLILSVSAERWTGLRAAFASGGIILAAIAFQWLISGSTHALFFILPILLFACLYWIRWWAVHPPRTWFDSIRQ